MNGVDPQVIEAIFQCEKEGMNVREMTKFINELGLKTTTGKTWNNGAISKLRLEVCKLPRKVKPYKKKPVVNTRAVSEPVSEPVQQKLEPPLSRVSIARKMMMNTEFTDKEIEFILKG